MLAVALIHNREANRIETARQCGLMLCDAAGAPSKIGEVWWQPPVHDESVIKLLAFDAQFGCLLSRWSTYLRQRWPGWVYALRFLLGTRLPDYLSGNRLAARRRRRGIEILLTAKHIQAWESFLQSDAAYLAVLESDVAYGEVTAQRLIQELMLLLCADQQNEHFFYADLAGGCTAEELGCNNLPFKQTNGFIQYENPITNTACAYIINKPLAERFVALIWQNPDWRTINADWLMNLLFMELKKIGAEIMCWHAQPPIFKHGSVEAVYASEIR